MNDTFQIDGLLLKDLKVSRDFEKISNKLLNQLEEMIEDTFISKEQMFQSLFLFKIKSNLLKNDFEITYSSNIDFTKDDEMLLKEWIKKDNLVESLYYEKFYRVALKNFILLFQIHFMDSGNQIFIGHILTNTLDTRLYLAELLQQSMFKNLL